MSDPKKILLVDDEPAILNLTSKMVNIAGFETMVANNAEEAIEIFKEHTDEIDCVMTDYNMPGLNGDELIMTLLSIRPELDTVLISGYDQRTYESEGGMLFENMRFLGKPFNRESLNSLLESL